MVIIGAKGHAIEILEILTKNKRINNLFFFDDVNEYTDPILFNKFKILQDETEVKEAFYKDNRFIIGIGNPKYRKTLAEKFILFGGRLTSVIASSAEIGSWGCSIGAGVNIMSKVFVSNNTNIGTGVLLNTGSVIHHDVTIGKYSEVSPNAVVLGKVKIGQSCFIGSNATILPGITIGNYVIVGAGAVVTKSIPDYSIVMGVPAKRKKNV